MDNTFDKSKPDSENKSANVILCHPDSSGDPVAEIFGELPPTLKAMADWSDVETRYRKAHPGHIGTLELGFQASWVHHVTPKPWAEYWRQVAMEVLIAYNRDDPHWHPENDPDLAVALAIAEDHSWFVVSNDTIPEVSRITRFIHVSKFVETGKEEDKFMGRADAFLDYLRTSLGFTWEWQGWDQEPRFVAQGLVRIPGTKIVLHLDGRYIISPRCQTCGGKTGWCMNFDNEEAAREEAAKPHYCNDCFFKHEFEEAKELYLRTGEIDSEVLQTLEGLFEDGPFDGDSELIERLGTITGEDRTVVRVEVKHPHGRVEVMAWYEWVERNWDRWVEAQEDELAECDADSVYCECPLEG